MSHEPVPVVVPPGVGASIPGPAGGLLTWKARGIETGGALTAFENTVAPFDGPPLHVHADVDETWFVLEGVLRFRFDDDLQPAPAGTYVFVPRGQAHCFQNVGTDPARILITFTPAGMESFFEEVAALAPGAGGQAAWGPIAARAGMTIVGPPLAVSHPRPA
jgi:mannose-6-phosphate isomerase-like protein (cupin superfamily)